MATGRPSCSAPRSLTRWTAERTPSSTLFERSDLAWKVVGSFSLPAPLTVTDSGRRLAFGGDDLVVGTGREVRILPERRRRGPSRLRSRPISRSPAANFQGLGFGRAVAIDGDTMLVTDQETAALYVTTRRRDGTWTFSQFLRVENRLSDDGFGSEVAIRGDPPGRAARPVQRRQRVSLPARRRHVVARRGEVQPCGPHDLGLRSGRDRNRR